MISITAPTLLQDMLPADWSTYDPAEKIAFFNSHNIAPDELAGMGVDNASIDWMTQNGYKGGVSTSTPPTAASGNLSPREFKNLMFEGGANASTATDRSAEYLRRGDYTDPDQDAKLLSDALGTTFEEEYYNRAMGLPGGNTFAHYIGELPGERSKGAGLIQGALTQTATPPVTSTTPVVTSGGGSTAAQTVPPYINPVTRTDNGAATSGTSSTTGANSPVTTGNQNALATVTGNGNQIGNGNVSGSYNTTAYNGWGTAGNASAPTYQTPILDALYAQRQQAMMSAAPTFNFQNGAGTPPVAKKKGGRIEGALTRCIKGR